MIALVDYHKGNLRSVEKSLTAAGGEVRITDDPQQILCADAIVLPGVGAFADAASTMTRLGHMQVIRDRIAQGTPFLGVCLGMHLMFEEGSEGTNFEDEEIENAHGLAVLPGVVTRMPRRNTAGKSFKVPHVGWNSLEFEGGVEKHPSPLLAGMPSGEYFYFTHSYVAPDSPSTLAYTSHSTTFPSIVSYHDTAFGVQFHPEKSSDIGMHLLKNFVNFVKGI